MTETPGAWLARLAGQLPGPLAHDLNNILAVLAGGLDLLEPRLSADPAAGARLLRLRRALDRAGALTAAMQVLTMTEPLYRLLPVLAAAAGSRSPIAADLPPDLPPPEADPAGLRAVLLALALGMRAAPGPVSLSAAVRDGQWVLRWGGLGALPPTEAPAIAAFLAAAGGAVALSADPPAITLTLPAVSSD
ncbi:MAG: hypothetical protein ACP5NI_12030 [Acetobacteraceae bacterium]